MTLEDDLKRRDLTVNAIARAEDGEIVDPWSGRADLAARVLRHVSPAFREDPLRVLRVARFAARFAPLGFTIAAETLELMKEIVAAGEMEALRPERVWQETVKALATERPDVYFETLRACGALKRIFPEVDALFGVPQPEQWHPEIDTGVHTLMALRMAAQLSRSETVRFAVLVHDLGKATTPKELLPRHHGHEQRSEELLEGLCSRLPVPNRFRDLARLVARHHGTVHKAAELKPQTILRTIAAADGLRQPERFDEMLLACEADARGRKGLEDRGYPQADRLRAALRAAKSVDAAKVKAERGLDGEALGLGAARRAARRDQDRARGVSARRPGTIGRRTRRRRRTTDRPRPRFTSRSMRRPIGNSTAASSVSSSAPSIAEASVAKRTFNNVAWPNLRSTLSQRS